MGKGANMIKTDARGLQMSPISEKVSDKWEFKLFQGKFTITGAILFRDLMIVVGMQGLDELKGNVIDTITSHLESQGYISGKDYLITCDP